MAEEEMIEHQPTDLEILIRAGHDALFEGEFVRALHVAEEAMRRSQTDLSQKGEALRLMAAVGEKLGRKGRYWRRG
ncbi:MAG: hypothetical protein KDD55_13510 [Bdellovibrionales bacterium]|nr:hypothetical protein [Bdellovibrionales bacterium]